MAALMGWVCLNVGSAEEHLSESTKNRFEQQILGITCPHLL